MSRRRKKKHRHDEVELNLAAMLDMAFQLLTFFILTFKPAPIEGQILMNLPPAQPISGAKGTGSVGQNLDTPPPPKDSLVVGVFGRNGKIESMSIADQNVDNIAQLEGRLRHIVGDKNSTFEQIVISVDSGVQYSEVMRIVDIFARLKRFDGSPVGGLSLVENPANTPK